MLAHPGMELDGDVDEPEVDQSLPERACHDDPPGLRAGPPGDGPRSLSEKQRTCHRLSGRVKKLNRPGIPFAKSVA